MKIFKKTIIILFAVSLLSIQPIFATNKNNTANSQPSVKEYLPRDTIIYKEGSIKINSINPTVKTNSQGASFPGVRGFNQLVVYTKKFGFRTNTNEFGTEVIVKDNTVVELSGADSIIPGNGFVISGHGKAKTWIMENLTIGAKVFIDNDTMELKSYIIPESFTFSAREKIKEVMNIVEYYDMGSIYYDDTKARAYVKKSKELIRKAEKNTKNVQKYAQAAIDNADLALIYALPYNANEMKGVWIRPTETTPEGIAKTLDNIQAVGIDNVFLETYLHGKTIYPSEVLKQYGVTNQYEDFVGFDPLKVWVTEAHKRNMKIHIWFESFYIGNKYNKNNPQHILNKYPEWANKTRAKYNSQEPVASASEHNGYFLDPANPDVQEYLLDILQEIVTKYKPDGINIDYIRYPQSIAKQFNGYENSNWGYTEYTRNAFKTSYGIDPIDITKDTDEWELWAKYRQDRISDFVSSVRRLTQCNGVMLTAVIFPDRKKCLETKMQDWSVWSLNNYIDGFTPLILTCDKQTAIYLIQDIKRNSTRRTKIYPGLFVTFMNGSKDDLLRQIHATRQLKSTGIILFDYAHLNDEYKNALNASAYNKKTALSPDSYDKNSRKK